MRRVVMAFVGLAGCAGVGEEQYLWPPPLEPVLTQRLAVGDQLRGTVQRIEWIHSNPRSRMDFWELDLDLEVVSTDGDEATLDGYAELHARPHTLALLSFSLDRHGHVVGDVEWIAKRPDPRSQRLAAALVDDGFSPIGDEALPETKVLGIVAGPPGPERVRLEARGKSFEEIDIHGIATGISWTNIATVDYPVERSYVRAVERNAKGRGAGVTIYRHSSSTWQLND